MKDTDKQEMMKQALEIANSIIKGETNPNKGCSELGELNRDYDWPEELSIFGLLSHEQYDHENLGITAENTVPQIIEECKNLVYKNS